jgi:hypothetical protein
MRIRLFYDKKPHLEIRAIAQLAIPHLVMLPPKMSDHFDCENRGKVEARRKGEIDMYLVLGEKHAA